MASETTPAEDTRNPAAENVKSFIAGGFGGVSAVLVGHPFDLTKTRLQTAASGQYTGAIDVVRKTLARDGLTGEGGIKSIFRGTGATLARDGPGSAAYFAAYEVTKNLLISRNSASGDLDLGAIILAGGTAGVAMWSLAIPPDVLKSRLQSAPTGTYSGLLDCLRKTVAQDGVTALWKGFGPAMARAFPANAATFLGVEASRKLLDSLF
ncbi:hypothetical protein ID866_1163 [Astraeus odoratus]|nr:hypothetical protein ID866_1163 [Astraeus odoratus]